VKYIIGIIKRIDKISETVGKAASVLLIFMVILEFGEVILRYVLGTPTPWSWEVATYLYGANFMLAGAWALKEGRHVRTDIVYDKLSLKRKAILDIITFSTIFLLFTTVMVYLITKAAIFSVSLFEYSYTMNRILIFPLKIANAIGFILLFLQGLAKIVRDIIFLKRGIVI
jgi:TRAP-type mannitol/chloroaromatic compound transport system permease small subunit